MAKRKPTTVLPDAAAPFYLVPMNTGVAVRDKHHRCVARLLFDDRCEDKDLRRTIINALTDDSRKSFSAKVKAAKETTHATH